MRVLWPLMVLLLMLANNATAGELPSATVSDGLGVVNHFVGTNDAQMDLIQAAGFKVIRQDVTWSTVEQVQGQCDFTAWDQLYASCVARGIRCEFILDYGNSLYGTDPGSQTFRNGFTNFAQAAAAHFSGKNVIWEIMNEPDGNVGLYMPANQYMDLLDQAAPVIRQADPSATLVSAAVFHDDYMAYMLSHGLMNLVDAVGVHPYRDSNPETVVASYAELRGWMQTYGGKVIPIADSEWGYSSGATGTYLQQEADYLARIYLVNLSQGVPLSVWYQWKDEPPGNGTSGVVANDLTPKPAYQTAQDLTTALNGKRFSVRLPSGTDDWLLVFTGPDGRQMLSGWTTGSPHNVTLAGGTILQVGSTPQYISIARKLVLFDNDYGTTGNQATTFSRPVYKVAIEKGGTLTNNMDSFTFQSDPEPGRAQIVWHKTDASNNGSGWTDASDVGFGLTYGFDWEVEIRARFTGLALDQGEYAVIELPWTQQGSPAAGAGSYGLKFDSTGLHSNLDGGAPQLLDLASLDILQFHTYVLRHFSDPYMAPTTLDALGNPIQGGDQAVAAYLSIDGGAWLPVMFAPDSGEDNALWIRINDVAGDANWAAVEVDYLRITTNVPEPTTVGCLIGLSASVALCRPGLLNLQRGIWQG